MATELSVPPILNRNPLINSMKQNSTALYRCEAELGEVIVWERGGVSGRYMRELRLESRMYGFGS